MGKKSTLFGPQPSSVITVGYIDPEKGYIDGVSINDANKYAKLNPGTVFLFLDGNKKLRYLNINEVNKLSPEDLVSEDKCNTEPKPCGPPKIQFWGGSGIGAAANPVIVNGSIVAVDLVRGGHGYQYPPFVSVKDDCNIGSGAVLSSSIGITTTAIEVYDREDDYEVYTIQPDDVTYPIDWGEDGQDLGSWNPDDFTGEGEDPIAAQIYQYQKQLSKLQRPWWTTRKKAPKLVTGGNKSYQKVYQVTHPAKGSTSKTWSDFMNSYAVSPVPASNLPGSDFAGTLFSMEWEENFPYTGEYIFRGCRDNIGKLYLDNQFVSDLQNFNENPIPFTKTIKGGNHKIRIDLLNLPIFDTIKTQAPPTITTETSTEVSTQTSTEVSTQTSAEILNKIICHAGGGFGGIVSEQQIKSGTVKVGKGVNGSEGGRNGASGDAGFIGGPRARRGGYRGPEITEYAASLSSEIALHGISIDLDGRVVRDDVGSKDGKPGYGVGGLATWGFYPAAFVNGGNGAARIKYAGKTQEYTKPGTYEFVVPEGTTNIDVACIGAGGGASFGFDNAKTKVKTNNVAALFAIGVGGGSGGAYAYENGIQVSPGTKIKVVVGAGGVSKDLGVAPGAGLSGTRELSKNLPTLSNIKGTNGGDSYIEIVERPITTSTTKTVATPTTKTITTKKIQSSTSDAIRTSVFNTVDYISKADRPLWRTNPTASAISSLADRYGITPFDSNTKESQTNSFAGVHVIRWQNVNFPTDGYYKIQVAVDDNVTIYIGNRETGGNVENGTGLRDINEGGDEVIIRKKGFLPGTSIGTPDLDETRYFKAGSYRIRAELEQIPGAALAKGNPMTLAINIEVSYTETKVVSAKSWYQNPLGVSLTIDAPEPPIPQEPPTQQLGRCPTNPIWSTRFPKSAQKWYPVKFRVANTWSKFMNRYAISPVPPLDTPGSDRAGINFTNTWDIEIPYDGYYGIKGCADDRGRVLIDNEEVYKLQGFRTENPSTTKKYLKKGSHKISVEVYNRPIVTSSIVNKKIFSTKDWQFSEALTKPKPVDVTFNIDVRGLYANGFKIPSLDISVEKAFGAGKEISQSIKKTLEYGKIYTVNLSTSPQGQIKMRTQGDNLLQIEDATDYNWSDMVCSTNIGRFFDLQGNTCKFIVEDKNIRQASISKTVNGITYIGPELYNYRHKAWSPFMNEFNVSPIIEDAEVNEDISGFNGGGIYLDLSNTEGSVDIEIQNVANSSDVFHGISIPGIGTVDENMRTRKYTVAGGKIYGPCKPTAPNTRLFVGDEKPKDVKSGAGSRPNTQLVCEESNDDWNDFVISTSVGSFKRLTEAPKRSKIIKKDDVSGERILLWKNVSFSEDGQYLVKMQGDNIATLYIGNEKIYETTDFSGGEPIPVLANITKGNYDVKIQLINIPLPAPNRNDDFNTNPTGVSLEITKDVVVETTTAGSWAGGNPVGASAVLIAPPCPKITGGKGVIDEVIVDDPGNNYIDQPESPEGYPVILVLDKVVVKDTGINYNCGVDKIRIVPDNGATLTYKCDTFGRIVEVNVSTPGSGYTFIPTIFIDSETGVNFSASPVLKPVREIAGVAPEKLIQVTDLVGLKQTGYVDGKSYYGAIYYENGLKYAGYFKTIGDPIRVYDTLQESITGRVTTPPSAIERSGTDINSNNPTLNIPGTLRNITNPE